MLRLVSIPGQIDMARGVVVCSLNVRPVISLVLLGMKLLESLLGHLAPHPSSGRYLRRLARPRAAR